MLDKKDFAIGVLAITAAILLVGFILVNETPPALAAGDSVTGGDYVLVTGHMSTTEELLYVIDTAAQAMVVYRMDPGMGNISIIDLIDLGRIKTMPNRGGAP